MFNYPSCPLEDASLAVYEDEERLLNICQCKDKQRSSEALRSQILHTD